MPFKDPVRKLEYNRTYYLGHKDVMRASSKRYSQSPKGEAKIRANYIKRLYNVTEVWYITKFAEQSGCCAICGKTTNKRLAIDHNHKTGVARGLLCFKCNTGLGVIENTDFIGKAKLYINKYKDKR